MHMHVLERDLLLALATVAIEGIEKHCIGSRQFIGLAQILASPLELLFAEHSAPVAFHGGIVCGDELSRDHALELVFRSDPDEHRHRCFVLTIARVFVRMRHPQRANGLGGENVFPSSDCDSPMRFKLPFSSSGSLATIVVGFLSAAGFFVLIATFLMLEWPPLFIDGRNVARKFSAHEGSARFGHPAAGGFNPLPRSFRRRPSSSPPF
jgi:hypothetical protein